VVVQNLASGTSPDLKDPSYADIFHPPHSLQYCTPWAAAHWFIFFQ